MERQKTKTKMPKFYDSRQKKRRRRERASCHKASVLIQSLSHPTETVLCNKITRKRIVPSF